MTEAPGLWVAVGVFALLPAVCEEVAFRGFILSGLEHQRRTRSAILFSALMFGFLHVLLSLFQQLFNATLLGIVLGLLAVRSRSLLPGILFHFLNNALAITLAARIDVFQSAGAAAWLYRDPDHGLYHETWLVLESGWPPAALVPLPLESRRIARPLTQRLRIASLSPTFSVLAIGQLGTGPARSGHRTPAMRRDTLTLQRATSSRWRARPSRTGS